MVPSEARRRCWESLKLDLWMILSHHVDAGNQTLDPCKSIKCKKKKKSKAINCWAIISPGPTPLIFIVYVQVFCLYLCTTCVQCLQRREEGITPWETRIYSWALNTSVSGNTLQSWVISPAPNNYTFNNYCIYIKFQSTSNRKKKWKGAKCGGAGAGKELCEFKAIPVYIVRPVAVNRG